jgi:UDP-N-acetylglucosamine---dolichyl-phosphate N-acetylglucosaminyltransferase
MKTIAVIPAYNEEQTIAEVLKRTRPFVDDIIVVDDGSVDRSARIARHHGALVVSHVIKRGLGAALGTGFEMALRMGADTVITLDADGQHDPAEIDKLLLAIENGADVVIGTRMANSAGMPWHRRVAQRIGNLTTFILFGVWSSDSQSGFRALSRHALSRIEIKTNRMEVSSELIAQTKHHELVLAEVPVKAIYTEYSLSKGQSFFVGLKTLLRLVLRRIMM